jgi:hypothetical protein
MNIDMEVDANITAYDVKADVATYDAAGGVKTEPKRSVDIGAMYRLPNSVGVKRKATARRAMAHVPVTDDEINKLSNIMLGMNVTDAPIRARKAPRKRPTNVEMATRRSTRVVSAPVPLVVESSKSAKTVRKPTAKKQVEALIRTARWNKDATARIEAAETALTVQLDIVAKAKAVLAQEESKLKAILTNLEAARKDVMEVGEPVGDMPVEMEGGRKKKTRK